MFKENDKVRFLTQWADEYEYAVILGKYLGYGYRISSLFNYTNMLSAEETQEINNIELFLYF